jgi:hypothetical protein
MYTDQLESVGNVRRVYMHFLARFDDDTKRWYYFGTLPTDPGKAPTTADPVTTSGFVAFPADFSLIGQDANDALYDLGIKAGLKRLAVT